MPRFPMPARKFKLTNEGAPAFSKPDPEAFIPMSIAQKIRQSIYSHLKKTRQPAKLSELITISKAPRYLVRDASLKLARKGIVKAKEITEPKPTKAKPENIIDSLELEFIEPWTSKLSQQP